MLEDNIKSRNGWWFLAVLAALAVAALRVFPYQGDETILLVKSLLHPTSLAENPLVRAIMIAPYTWAPKAVAYLSYWLCASLSLSPNISLNGLMLILWGAQAAIMFLVAREAAGNEEAGFLAALFIGAGMPFVLADAAGYSIQGVFRRDLFTPVFLWGLLALLRGRRWQALVAFVIATYLHAVPGIYAWPLLFWEDAIEAWRRPESRRVFWLRLAALAAAALPLLLATLGHGKTPADPEFVRMNLVLSSWYIGGANAVPADWVFLLEGTTLVVFVLWQGRRLKAAPFLWRMLGVCAALLAFGVLSYQASLARWPGAGLWRIGVMMQPWQSLCLVELVGELALAAWLAERMREKVEAVPAILVMMASSASHDFVLRLACLGACACLAAGRLRAAVGLILGACALPFLYLADTELFRRAALACGLRGGLFSLPAFHYATSLALAAALGLGFWLSRRPGTYSGRFCAAWAVVVFLATAGIRRVTTPGPLHKLEGMAEWIQQYTPPQAVIAASPLEVLGASCEPFMSMAERSVFACERYAYGATIFGPASAALIENLKVSGMDFANVRKEGDYAVEVRRFDAAMTPERAARLFSERRVTHILLRSERPWPGQPEHREGGLALYRLPPPLTRAR